ncbi:MAG: helix-turn-helix transcriptional regulator [Lacipirellulaceae bacterium]
MHAFGQRLRQLRIDAGLGLRTFAQLVDQRASVVSAVESGRRGPWRDEEILLQVANVLGVEERVLEEADSISDEFRPDDDWSLDPISRLHSWVLSPAASAAGGEFDDEAQTELTETLGVQPPTLGEQDGFQETQPLTDLAVEWQARRLTARLSTPVDVEAALERNGVRLEIVAGLVPRYSVQACVTCEEPDQEDPSSSSTIWIDRTIADSHPIASYRLLLARAYAPLALRSENLQDRDAKAFALAMLLPAAPLQAAAETAYTDYVDRHGWLSPGIMKQYLCNQLAEAFAAPPHLIAQRLDGWPCPITPRLELALETRERTLPPTDWERSPEPAEQMLLFT